MRPAVLVALLGLALAAGAEARIDNWLWNTHTYGFQQSGVPTGKVVKLGPAGNSSIETYIAAPSGKPTAAVIIFPDVYGWQWNNTRLWADRLAKAGFLAVLPDWFRGDVLGSDVMAFIGRQKKDRVIADFNTVVAAIKKAYPSVKKIGQEGFCWGGLYTALLSTPQAPKVDAAVAFHASLLTPKLIDAITGPVSLQQADPLLDTQINSTFYKYIEGAFKAKQAKGGQQVITYYKGMPHGFSVRGNFSIPAFAKASNTAFDEGVKFLKQHLLSR